MTAMHTR